MFHTKPIAYALKRTPEIIGPLNEVTVTIQKEANVNYHETFMLDTTRYNHFEYNGVAYKIPPQHVGHYTPSYWSFDRKLALFFEHHKTLALFLDWFHFRDKAAYEIGLLYTEGNPEPEKLEPPEIDYALINFMLSKNSTLEATYKDADNILKGSKSNIGNIAWLFLIIFGVVAVIILYFTLTGAGSQPSAVNNATSTAKFILGSVPHV